MRIQGVRVHVRTFTFKFMYFYEFETFDSMIYYFKLSLTQLKTLSRGQNAVISNSNQEFQLCHSFTRASALQRHLVMNYVITYSPNPTLGYALGIDTI